jgi:DNA-binding SARP family transcriptional activator/tetratricopeptide (TPR) repeat protein
LHLELAHHARVRGEGHAVALAPLDGALLAWLALEGPTSRARLASLLWPGSELDAARNSLRQRLHRLRRQVGAALVAGSGTLLTLADGVQHDLEDSDGVLSDVPDEIGGEFSVWLEQQRGRRRDRMRGSLVELSDMAEQVRDWADALGHAQELLALEPLSEEAHRRVIRLHYLAGDRSAALLAFDACERRLKDDVGARPSAETLALLATIDQAQTPPAVSRAGRPVPASVLRPPRMVGRAAEWQALHDAWAGGCNALVSAEGGLGKSRLATDFAASQGATVVVCGARPGDGQIPFASISRLLRALPGAVWLSTPDAVRRELARWLPELGDPPPPLRGPTDTARLFNAVMTLLEHAGSRVHGIVFDDLHFADTASIELLQPVLGARTGRWLLTARPSELSPAGLRLVDACLSGPEAVQVPLGPLTRDEVAELIDSLGIPGLTGERSATPLLQRSGGNPLFLLEAVKAGWNDALPSTGLATSSVHALIERRITRLSVPAVQLARCAAVATPDFSIELAAHVLALRTIDLADPWAELEAAQVLVDGRFAHDLIHEAALASVPAAVARQLHAEVAAFLALRGAEPARLAHHWVKAQRWTEAGAASRAAAERALTAARVGEAADLLAESARCFEAAGLPDERFDTLLRRARVMAENRFGTDGLAAVAQVRTLARGDDQALQALDVQLALAMSRGETGDTVRAGRAALAAAKALGRTDLELRFAIVVSDALCDSREAAQAVVLLEPYADAARSAPLDTHWDYWCGVAIAFDYADRLHEALPAWEAARTVARQAGRDDMLWKTMSNAASTLAKMGFVQRAAEQCEQACRLAQAAGEASPRVAQARVTWAHRLRDCGRYTQAMALLEEARATHAESSGIPDIAGTEHRLAQLYQQLGQPARAAQLLAPARPGLAPGLAMMRLVHQADVAHQLGRDGLPQLREALAIIDNPDDVYHRIASLFATRQVPPDDGEALATSLAAWAGARGRLGIALAGHVRAAACALALGAPRRARPHAEAALHLSAEHQPDSFYLPEMWLVAGQVNAALERHAVAAQLWNEGAAWVRRTAATDVPPEYQDSFLHRNPVNAALLQRAGRALPPRAR